MHHHRLKAWVFGLLAMAILSPVLAQSWHGSETMGVQANDSKGKPIAGARVVLSYQGRDSQDNPPDVATNQKGRAVITGLAPGSWQVEVIHPDYLSYVAVFDLRGGKKPSVTASFLEAGGGSLTPMRVKLSKGNPREASPPMPTREARVEPSPTTEPEPVATEVEAAPEEIPTPAPAPVDPPTPIETSPQPTVQAEAEPDPEPESRTIQQEPETPEETPVEPAPAEEAPVTSTVPEVAETVSEPTPEAPEISRPSPQPVAEVETEPAPEVRAEVEPPPPEVETPEAAAEVAPTTEEPVALPLPEPEAEVVIAEREPEPEQPSIPEPLEGEPVSEPAQILETPAEPEPEVQPEPTEQPVAPPEVAEEDPTPEPLPEETTPVEAPVEPAEPVTTVTETPVPTVAPPPTRQAPAARVPLPDETPPISSYHDGSCSECRTGEWAVAAFQTAAAGGAPCPVEVTQNARVAAETLGGSTQLELSGFIGPAADGSGGDALAAAEPEISQSYRQQLSPFLGSSTNCQVISVVLPKTVRFVGFRYEAYDDGGGGDCTPGQGCMISRAQWLGNPVIQRGPNATVVWGVFESTAEEKPRLGRLKIYFRAPNARWQPPAR